MDTREYIESGILELYVYGLLDDDQNVEISQMAKNHQEVHDEIVSIEKAIVDLSTGFCPYLSAETFEKIRSRLALKYEKAERKSSSNWGAYMGWAAALLFLLGIGYLYTELDDSNIQLANSESDKIKLQESVVKLEIENKQTESVLAVIRDDKNIMVPLGGQAVAPQASAKVYWNRETQAVYVDAAGLPDPPEGMVYQVWALKLNPLTPTSIGLLENFTADAHRMFPADATSDAEAFGITLEPVGGSASPRMEQLYTLGKV